MHAINQVSPMEFAWQIACLGAVKFRSSTQVYATSRKSDTGKFGWQVACIGLLVITCTWVHLD